MQELKSYSNDDYRKALMSVTTPINYENIDVNSSINLILIKYKYSNIDNSIDMINSNEDISITSIIIKQHQ